MIVYFQLNIMYRGEINYNNTGTNSKTLYSNLHRNDIHTFVIHKKDLSSMKSSSQQFNRASQSQSEWKRQKNSFINQLPCHIYQKKKLETSQPKFKLSQKLTKYSKEKMQNLLQNTKATSGVFNHLSRKVTHKSQSLRKKQIKRIKQNTQTDQILPNNKVLTPQFYSYLRYIHSKQKSFHLHFDFSFIKTLRIEEAWRELDFKIIKMMQGIIKRLRQIILEKKDENNETIKEICRVYFFNHEKIRVELILRQHYFKLFAFRLQPIFILMRIILYFVYILADKETIYNQHLESLEKSLQNLKDIFELIIEIIMNIEKNRKGKQINQAFKILKWVGDVEKKLSHIETEVEIIRNYHSLKQFVSIFKTFKGFFQRDYKAEQLMKAEMITSWKYLNVPPTPFLPTKTKFPYSLVLALDETLIYFSSQTHLLKYRPGLDLLFKTIRQHFQLIIFTSSSKAYADTIIDQIQTKSTIFQYRLYREHLILQNDHFIKDLKRLGRDLSKTLIVDDEGQNLSEFRRNGIQICSWRGLEI